MSFKSINQLLAVDNFQKSVQQSQFVQMIFAQLAPDTFTKHLAEKSKQPFFYFMNFFFTLIALYFFPFFLYQPNLVFHLVKYLSHQQQLKILSSKQGYSALRFNYIRELKSTN